MSAGNFWQSLPPLARMLCLELGIFLVALALRLCGLSLQNLWYDEHWTLLVAGAPIASLPDLLPAAESTKPPLYFAFMHYWMLFGAGEFWLRLPSAIFGATDCVVAVALGRQLLGHRGLWLGWLLVISPFHIYYSQEARPYALWGLLVTLTLLLHLKYCARPQVTTLLGYILVGLLACYTFAFSLFLVVFSLLFTSFYRPALPARHRLQLAFANGAIILLYLPWLWKLYDSVAHNIGFLPTHGRPFYAAAPYALFCLAFGSSAGPSLERLRFLGPSILKQAPSDGAMLLLGLILILVLLSYGLTSLWRSNRNAFWFSLAGLGAFWGMVALLNLANPSIPLNPRYVFPALLPLLLVVFPAVISNFGKGVRHWVLALLFLGTISSSLANHYFNPDYRRDDLRAAAQFVRKLQPAPDQVVVCAGHLVDVFRYYLADDFPVEPLTIPLDASPETSLAQIPRLSLHSRRLALVYSRPDHGDPNHLLPGALRTRYRLAQQKHWTGVDVFVFETFEGANNSSAQEADKIAANN